MKFHTGDTVVIISGKDKGKSGTIMRVLPSDNHVVVTGINMRTRHVKKTYQEAGRIIKYEASIDASKVMLLDPKTKKPSRIGYVMENGKKKRISKASGEAVTKVKLPKKAAAKKEEKVADEAPVAGGSKQRFWNKLQFGATAAAEGGAPEEARSKQDHTIPSQNIPRKSSGRGS
jgi:large subunit ribosomal protein L24